MSEIVILGLCFAMCLSMTRNVSATETDGESPAKKDHAGTFKIAAVAVDGFTGPTEKNLATLKRALATLRQQDVEFAVFPEGFLTGYSDGSSGSGFARKVAVSLDSPIIDELKRIVKDSGMYVSVGLWEDADGIPVMSQIIVGPDGIVDRFQKVHPAEGYGRRGKTFSVADLGSCRVGTMICKDAGYPESYRALALMGADVILHPVAAGSISDKSKFTPPKDEAFSTSHEIANACKNRCYYVGVNWAGSYTTAEGEKKHFPGNAIIADPTGKLLARVKMDFSPLQIAVADINPGKFRFKRLTELWQRTPAAYSVIARAPKFDTCGLPSDNHVFFKRWQASPMFPIKHVKKDKSHYVDGFASSTVDEARISAVGLGEEEDWKTVSADSIFVDLYDVYGCVGYQGAYLLTRYDSPAEMNGILTVKGAEAVEAWLNGEQIVKRADDKPVKGWDGAQLPVALKKGANYLLVKCANLDRSVWAVVAYFEGNGEQATGQ